MSGMESASLTKAERTIEKLRDENSRLRTELHETKSLYCQLVQESERESFDERRVLLLKSQLIQLERQLLLMNEAMSSRANINFEIEIAMLDVADRCRKFISIDNKSPNVSIPRAELIKQVEQAESVRLKLSKCIENNSIEKLAKPLLLMNGFIKDSAQQECTIFDLCSGKLDHLNLKHVGKLENELIELYGHLLKLENALGQNLVKKQHHDAKVHMPLPEMERQYLATQTAVDKIQTCCGKLLNLSVLIPAAPLPAFKSKVKGVSIEKILSSLPKAVKNKSDTRQVIEALMKSLNYHIHMKSVEIDALKDELKFHQSFYEQQCQYMDNLFGAMKVGYRKFENNAMECLVIPLEEILEKYEILRSDASEDALREFLTTFKTHADALQSAVDKLKPESNEERAGALAGFGEQFFADLDILQQACANKRDDFLANLDIVKRQRDEYSEELELLLQPRSSTVPNKSNAKLEYERLIAMEDDGDEFGGDGDHPNSKSSGSYKPPKKRISQECDGCKDDVSCSMNQTEKTREERKTGPSSSTLNLDESRSETRKTRTSITGSNIPKTPSSSAGYRRASIESKAQTGRSSLSSVPVRNLKLKK